jgi:NAD(P)-dependent dehydrogenase (short-subunit alcohol dehydrogenase family)
MAYDFSQKSALITGAASGIGLAMAHQLAKAGAAQLVLTDRIAQTLEDATQVLRARCGSPGMSPMRVSGPTLCPVLKGLILR